MKGVTMRGVHVIGAAAASAALFASASTAHAVLVINSQQFVFSSASAFGGNRTFNPSSGTSFDQTFGPSTQLLTYTGSLSPNPGTVEATLSGTYFARGTAEFTPNSFSLIARSEYSSTRINIPAADYDSVGGQSSIQINITFTLLQASTISLETHLQRGSSDLNNWGYDSGTTRVLNASNAQVAIIGVGEPRPLEFALAAGQYTISQRVWAGYFGAFLPTDGNAFSDYFLRVTVPAPGAVAVTGLAALFAARRRHAQH